MGTEIAFIIALTIAVAAIFWLILRSASEKIIIQYRHFSEKLKLEVNIPESKLLGFVRNEPAAFGTYRGREISLSAPGKGLQNTRQIETVLKIELRDKELRAQFTAAGLIGRFKQRDSGGMSRWESGHASFDQAIDVRSNHGEQLKALLNKEELNWLASTLKKSKGSIYIGNGTLVYTELGLMGNEASRQRFEQVVEFLCNLAETVEA